MVCMVPAILLAAGRSVRMGSPKALLPHRDGGEPLVVRLATALEAGGVTRVLVVGREDDAELRGVVRRRLPRARFVVNPHADAGGPLSSIIAGLEAIDGPEVRAIMVTPVDIGELTPGSVAALLTASRGAPERIVRAVHGGRHGHPVIFPRVLFDEIRGADPAVGAKAVVRAHAREVIDLEVPDRGVVDDVDTPEDYARVFGVSSQ